MDADDFEDATDALSDEPDGTPSPAEQPDVVDALDVPDDYLGDDDVLAVPAPSGKRQEVPRGEHRISQAERTLRIALVAQMRIQGFKRADVIRYVYKNLVEQWNVPSERTIERYIEAADKMIRTEAVRDVTLEKGKAIARYDDLFRKCNANKLFGTALRVQRSINRMLGLDAPLAVKHGNDPVNPMPANSGPFIVLVQEVEEG